MPRAVDGDPVAALFSASRARDEAVRPTDWHPSPRWAEVDQCDTVAMRRGWFWRALLSPPSA